MVIGCAAGLSVGLTLLICLLAGVSNPWLWVLCLAGSFLLVAALSVAFLFVMAQRVDQSVPQEQDSPFFRRMALAYASAIITLCRVRVKKTGMEKLPKQGRYVLVCNHVGDADPVALLHCFPKSQLAFITKKENTSLPIVGGVMHKTLCQPIDRENDRAALRTIIKCIQILKEDKASIAVFPEGYSSLDGLLRHFRPGVFKIAQKANVPIVVCTLRGTVDLIARIKKFRGGKVEMHLVGVIQPEEFADKKTVDIAQQVYQMMAQDLGPEMVYQGE